MQDVNTEDVDTDGEDSLRLRETDHRMEEARSKHLLTIVITLARCTQGAKEELRRGQENVQFACLRATECSSLV